MKEKIAENIRRGRYTVGTEGLAAYQNRSGGWQDHLIADQVIFSHRVNDYVPASFAEQLHAHDYCELTLCGAGDEVQYIADGQNLTVTCGVTVLTKPMTMHMFRLPRAVHYDRYVLYFKPSALLFSDRSVWDFLTAGSDTHAVFAGEALTETAKKIETALTSGGAYGSARALLHVVELFLLLSEGMRQGVVCPEAENVPPFIHKVKQYVDEHYTEIKSVTALAELFFYSREHMARTFRRYYNTPLYEYILRRKLLHSCSMLLEGSTVEDAAAASGFDNMSCYIKLFRRERGCTPSEYKRRAHITKA